jgi:hypothetical protein
LSGRGTGAQGNTLVYDAVVADFRRLADNDAHAVVYEDSSTDCGTGVNFNTGEDSSDMRHQPPRGAKTRFPEGIGNFMEKKGVKAGIAQNYLKAASCCWVFGKYVVQALF